MGENIETIKELGKDFIKGTYEKGKNFIEYVYFFPSHDRHKEGYPGFIPNVPYTLFHTAWVSAIHLIPYLSKILVANQEEVYLKNSESNLYLFPLIPIITNLSNIAYHQFKRTKKELKKNKTPITIQKPSNLEKEVETNRNRTSRNKLHRPMGS